MSSAARHESGIGVRAPADVDRGHLGAIRCRAARHATALAVCAVTLVYVGLAVAAYHQTLFPADARIPGCACGDQAQEVWFLRWPLYALTHGHNPFFTTWMDYPQGANLAVNTTAPLLGVVSAPLQLLAGSVAAYNVLLALSLAGSGLSMCLALRRWVRTWTAAFLGGLVFAFSPYFVGQGSGHLFLVAVFIPPIVLVVLDDLLVTRRRSARFDGIALGVLAAAQYYISPEVLAMTAAIAACGIALLAIARPHAVRPVFGRALHGGAYTVVICVAALAYPIWMSVAGPQHVVGPPHPVATLARFPGDLLGPAIPTTHQLLAPAAWKVHGDLLSGSDSTENGMYLGVPLVVVLAACTRIFRRSAVLVFFVGMTVVSGVLALGSQLFVDAHATGIPLPFDVLTHIPLLQDILAVRFSLFIQLFAASALVVALELVFRRVRERSPDASKSRVRAFAAVAAVAVVALLPLVPALPFTGVPTSISSFYTSKAVDRIPPGSAVLSYPYPTAPSAEEAMLGQVQAGMRFKIVGGDAFVPAPTGKSVSRPTTLHPAVVERFFTAAFTPGATGPPPRVNAADVAALRTFLRHYRISTVIFQPAGADPGAALSYIAAALGAGTKTGGLAVWFDVPRILAAR